MVCIKTHINYQQKIMKLRTFHYNSYPGIRARPLKLKEVLQLRDGIKSSTAKPYQIKKIAHDEIILLALN